jgi:hypothetical protein
MTRAFLRDFKNKFLTHMTIFNPKTNKVILKNSSGILWKPLSFLVETLLAAGATIKAFSTLSEVPKDLDILVTRWATNCHLLTTIRVVTTFDPFVSLTAKAVVLR